MKEEEYLEHEVLDGVMDTYGWAAEKLARRQGW